MTWLWPILWALVLGVFTVGPGHNTATNYLHSLPVPLPKWFGRAEFAGALLVVSGLLLWQMPGRAGVDFPGVYAALAFANLSLLLSAVDAICHRLPNRLMLPAAGLVLGGHLVNGFQLILARQATWAQLGWDIAWALGMCLVCLAVGIALAQLGAGLGMGDVKLAGVIGLFLGFAPVTVFISALVWAFVGGGIYAVILLAAGRAKRSTRLAFGPWLSIGAVAAWLWA